MRLALIVLLGLLISACSSVQTVEGVRPFKAADYFVAEGKLGIRAPGMTESARFVWNQSGEKFLIKLLDPFGRVALRLEGDDEQVEMEVNGDETIYRATSPESLMQTYLGWRVPVRPAKYWIQGVSAPGTPSKKESATLFSQSNWTIELSQTQDLPNLTDAPRRIKLEREDLQLTLIFSSWSHP